MRLAKLLSAIALIASGTLALSACTSPVTPSVVVAMAPGDIVTIRMPELLPRPVPLQPTPEAIEELRLKGQAELWKMVTQTFPELAHPDTEFVAFLAGDERLEALVRCYETAGMPVEEGVGKAGLVAVSAGMSTERAALATFTCHSAFPPPVAVPPTDEELGWLFDYLTRFLVPCYAANGIETPSPPTRADFVKKWPEQGWFPAADDRFLDPAMERALDEACPTP